MNNTIAVTQNPQSQKFQPDAKWKTRKRLVSWSGYAALGAGTVCGITGFRKVKIPHKHAIHKGSAYIAGIASFLHFGFCKGLSEIFTQKAAK